MEKRYKNPYTKKLRIRQFIASTIAVVIIVGGIYILGWRGTAALFIMLGSLISLVFLLIYFLPSTKLGNDWIVIFLGSLLSGIIFSIASFLLTLIDPKTGTISDRITISGKVGLITFIVMIFWSSIIRKWPGLLSTGKEFTEKIFRRMS